MAFALYSNHKHTFLVLECKHPQNMTRGIFSDANQDSVQVWSNFKHLFERQKMRNIIGIGTTCQVINCMSQYFREIGHVKCKSDSFWVLTIRVPGGMKPFLWVEKDVEIPLDDLAPFNDILEVAHWEIERPVSESCCVVL